MNKQEFFEVFTLWLARTGFNCKNCEFNGVCEIQDNSLLEPAKTFCSSFLYKKEETKEE